MESLPRGAYNTEPGRSASHEIRPLAGVPICVIGGGFVGLVAAAGFVQFGHTVVCVEKDRDKLEQLRSGSVPFYEKDLDSLFRDAQRTGRLTFSGDLDEAVKDQRAIFIAVGTPPADSGRADLGALGEVTEILARVLDSSQIVVLKSTVPVGTGARVRRLLEERAGTDKVASVINNPEFLREGNAVHDFFHPPRIVIGGDRHEAVEFVSHIYRLGMTHPVPIVVTNNETAELIKYASNAFLATKIGFINELSGLCDLAGVNILEVARAIGMDPRIGSEFLNPGPGWGGSCLRKDLLELSGLADSHGYELMIGRSVLEANLRHQEYVVARISKLVGGLRGSRIAVLGLSFKADTSDMRDSAAIPVVRHLLQAGAEVIAFDPKAMPEAPHYLPEVPLAADAYEAARDADCVVILTEWQEFQLLDLRRIAETMRHPNMMDARNLLTPELAARYGINYASMGQA